MRITIAAFFVVVLLVAGGYFFAKGNFLVDTSPAGEDVVVSLPTPEPVREEYTGIVRHIFFHSLIIYPEKALSDSNSAEGYKDNMITAAQFKRIIQQLYDNNFILIDARRMYSVDSEGSMHANKLYLPRGKKPLIISIDDLSYYSYMKQGGFARKLVVEDDVVKTEVLTPEGAIITTDDGDVVPIVDAFVEKHPDFSLDGAKGIIALTGLEGVLGYRTNWRAERGDIERQKARVVVEALKKSGWAFASHSFSHNQFFRDGTATSDFLANDISLWAKQVEPVVGTTSIFIGPFGQIFSDGDPRRQQLLDAGFTILYGVGMDNYTEIFSNYAIMNRTNIDGYRLRNNPKKLLEVFGISVEADF